MKVRNKKRLREGNGKPDWVWRREKRKKVKRQRNNIIKVRKKEIEKLRKRKKQRE